MTDTKKPPRQRRANPRYRGRRDAMLGAARDLFLAVGYDINLDEVAARAGVAKKTVYNHFGTKLGLLEAVVEQFGAAFVRDIKLHEGEDLGELLMSYAQLYEEHSFTAEGIQLHKLIVADVSEFPEIAAIFYQNGINRVAAALTAQLDKALIEKRIAPFDTRAAAEQFLGAITGLVRHRALAGLGIDKPAVRSAHLAQVVALFVKGLTP